MTEWPCHSLPREQWCDRHGPGGFMGHTCVKPPETVLTRDDVLVLLIEECGEVIQAATKCLRFGYERNQPGYGINHAVLAQEIGDLMGAVDALPLDWTAVAKARKAKIEKALRVKAEFGRTLGD